MGGYEESRRAAAIGRFATTFAVALGSLPIAAPQQPVGTMAASGTIVSVAARRPAGGPVREGGRSDRACDETGWPRRCRPRVPARRAIGRAFRPTRTGSAGAPEP